MVLLNGGRRKQEFWNGHWAYSRRKYLFLKVVFFCLLNVRHAFQRRCVLWCPVTRFSERVHFVVPGNTLFRAGAFCGASAHAFQRGCILWCPVTRFSERVHFVVPGNTLFRAGAFCGASAHAFQRGCILWCPVTRLSERVHFVVPGNTLFREGAFCGARWHAFQRRCILWCPVTRFSEKVHFVVPGDTLRKCVRFVRWGNNQENFILELDNKILYWAYIKTSSSYFKCFRDHICSYIRRIFPVCISHIRCTFPCRVALRTVSVKVPSLSLENTGFSVTLKYSHFIFQISAQTEQRETRLLTRAHFPD